MDNSTVLLSVVEDLIHWPLPLQSLTGDAASPSAEDAASEAVDVDALWREDAPLTAGGVEDLNEEPRVRQRSRYNAVRRLPALTRALGSQWAKTEIISYMLRCIEEEDAELSFATGMALIDFATPSFRYQQQMTSFAASHGTSSEKPFVGIDRLFSLENLLPVVMRMAVSSDVGVCRFLVEVVIPMLFFGVPLERCIDLRDWEVKYLNLRPDDGDNGDADEEAKVTFEVNGDNSVVGRETRHTGRNSSSGGSSTHHGRKHVNRSSKVVWDVFEINLYANRLRSAIATYLHDLSADSTGTEGPMLASCGKTVERQDYTSNPVRREAFSARWSIFIGLMERMLKSKYVAAVSAAVECISNIFSCITWVERMERRPETPSRPSSSSLSMLRSIEELVTFVFVTTRTHVGRAIFSGVKSPCEDLMMVLFDNGLLSARDTSVPSNAEDHHDFIMLGCGGLNKVERGVWNLYLGSSAPAMHRMVRMSLLRSLSQFIDWSRSAVPAKSTTVLTWLGGLSFSSVCHIFAQALATPTSPFSSVIQHDHDNGSDAEYENDMQKMKVKDGGKLEEFAASGDVLLLIESDACRDFGIAEAVLDGVQQMLDELLRPHTIEDFLQKAEGLTSRPTLEEKKVGLLRLCNLYRNCIISLAGLPSWRARWLTAQRMPRLTMTLVGLLRRVGNHDVNDGPPLVETCVEFLCRLHVEQWSSPSSSLSTQGFVGSLKGLMFDEEEEVRNVAAVCCAGVFRELGQGMFCLVFPHGVVGDMHSNSHAASTGCGTVSSKSQSEDPTKNVPLDMKITDDDSNSDNNKGNSNPYSALLSVRTMVTSLTSLFDAIFSCCVGLLCDQEERVRSGAAAGLSTLVRTLSTMMTACDLHVEDLCKKIWLRHLDNTTASLMTLLTDPSPTVQLALVSELAALLASGAAGAGRLATRMGGRGKDEAAQVREGVLVTCLRSLSQHKVWRYRERFARLLSEMCVKFLVPNSLPSTGTTSFLPPCGVYLLEEILRRSNVGTGHLGSNVVVGEEAIKPLHRFAREELLPLLVDVLFDKVKAVRDSALEALEKMCARLSEAKLYQKSSLLVGNCSYIVTDTRYSMWGDNSKVTTHYSRENRQKPFRNYHHDQQYDDSVFINKTLWPLIVSSPKAMATYLSRSSLLRIAVRLGVDKESILLPLLDYLGHDAVLNVRLVVAKELFVILSASSNSASSFATGRSRVIFTEEEKNGVVLQLLRLLVEDKSGDVRDEAAKALKLCF